MHGMPGFMKTLASSPVLRALHRWWVERYVIRVDHEAVVQHVRKEGRLTSRYSFMATISCAIAILGLLLSSPAVVIGAMLVSPLMAPIVSLGFSLCLLDIDQLKKALEGVLVGVAIALATSWLIVTMSPLTEPTPEILARTQPNLFDLLVAVFSGLAGGYAEVKRKGETLVGVAIATALMPPLAVVGFGLATGSAPIAKGAFMLFMTNLLAISLSVTLIAKLYGFGSEHGGKHTAWQIMLVAIVFGVLSLPLGVALKSIAYQTYVTKISRSVIRDFFGPEKSRISVFNIAFSSTDKMETSIDAVILTPRYRSGAQAALKALLAEKTGADIAFSLDQIVVDHETIVEAEKTVPQAENALNSALNAQPPHKTRTEEMSEALNQAVFFPADYIKVDAENKIASIHAGATKGVDIVTLRQFENGLTERYPGWTIHVIPPFQALPPVYFESGADSPSATEEENIADIIWALHRWGTEEVAVVGFASTAGELESFDNTSLAWRRATNIRKRLEQSGVRADARAEYLSFRQRDKERDRGTNSFQRVEIRILPLPEISENNGEEKQNVIPVENSGAQTP